MDVGEKFLVMPSPGRNAFLHGVADKYALSSRLRRTVHLMRVTSQLRLPKHLVPLCDLNVSQPMHHVRKSLHHTN
jgi:hypothetical protein